MPTFAMIGHDGPNGAEIRKPNRAAHIAHITKLDQEGCIVLAGPIRSEDGTRSVGALIVFTADDLDAAKKLVHSDPYVVAGVFETLTVEPFHQATPEPT